MAFLFILVAITMIIFSHELSHMAVAMHYGIKIEELSIGMGPLVYQRQIKGLKCSLRIIPLGGYCLMNTENFEAATHKQKIAIMIAGVLVNIITAYICFFFATMSVTKAFTILGVCFQAVAMFIVELFRGHIGASDFSGPIGAFNGLGEMITGIKSGLIISGFVAALLGISNLLPLPGFDGGRIVGILYEMITNKTISKKTHMIVNTICILITFFVLALGFTLDFSRYWLN